MTHPIDAKLAELGLSLPNAPAPAANYVPFVRMGDTLYVSGQVSSGPDGFITGKLGDNMDVAAGAKAAETCALSMLAQVRAACDGDFARFDRVLKLTGFVNSTADFTDQPKVINGASDLPGGNPGRNGPPRPLCRLGRSTAFGRRGRNRRHLCAEMTPLDLAFRARPLAHRAPARHCARSP